MGYWNWSERFEGKTVNLCFNIFKRVLLNFTVGDFFFGDGEDDQMGYDYETTSLTDLDKHGQDWVLPNEAFQPRHEINGIEKVKC